LDGPEAAESLRPRLIPSFSAGYSHTHNGRPGFYLTQIHQSSSWHRQGRCRLKSVWSSKDDVGTRPGSSPYLKLGQQGYRWVMLPRIYAASSLMLRETPNVDRQISENSTPPSSGPSAQGFAGLSGTALPSWITFLIGPMIVVNFKTYESCSAGSYDRVWCVSNRR